MNSNRQLMLAWRMYTEDNQDRVPLAYTSVGAPNVWITGSLSLNSPTDPVNWDPRQTVEKSPLWPYCGKNYAIWRCPADRSTAGPAGGTRVSRTRSRSMNLWVGGHDGTAGYWDAGGPWRVFRKFSDMTVLPPTEVWVLLDEREDSINDGLFIVKMEGFPDITKTWIVDYPASYHAGAAGFSFADGHSEIHRWRDRRTMPAISATDIPLNISSPNNQDVYWMQQHSTRKQ